MKVVLVACWAVALCLTCAAQEKKPGDVWHCTEPGVLTKEKVDLKAPVELLIMTTYRHHGFVADVGFQGADRRSILFTFDEGKKKQFTVVHKCRMTDGGSEAAETEAVAAGEPKGKAILKFISDWFMENVPEPTRAELMRIHGIKPHDRWDEAMQPLSDEDEKVYYLLLLLEKNKALPAGLK